jgi:TonB family protein
MLFPDCVSQDVKKKTINNDAGFKESFYVLKKDNKTKHGQYTLLYGKDTIQNGFYSNDRKTGVWKYFQNNNIEFIYNFETNRIISDSVGKARDALFSEGRVLLDYFIWLNTAYPIDLTEAYSKHIGGDVVMAFTIDIDGIPGDFELERGCGNTTLNNEALKIIKKVAQEHTWYPAIDEKGNKIKSKITSQVRFKINQIQDITGRWVRVLCKYEEFVTKK